jgi:hypothetical protein
VVLIKKQYLQLKRWRAGDPPAPVGGLFQAPEGRHQLSRSLSTLQRHPLCLVADIFYEKRYIKKSHLALQAAKVRV